MFATRRMARRTLLLQGWRFSPGLGEEPRTSGYCATLSAQAGQYNRNLLHAGYCFVYLDDVVIDAVLDWSAVGTINKVNFAAFQVWGLRETIGTVSGQNPSLRAPPRLATGIRDVSLQMEVSPRQSRWKQILVSLFALHCILHPTYSSCRDTGSWVVEFIFVWWHGLALTSKSSKRACFAVPLLYYDSIVPVVSSGCSP